MVISNQLDLTYIWLDWPSIIRFDLPDTYIVLSTYFLDKNGAKKEVARLRKILAGIGIFYLVTLIKVSDIVFLCLVTLLL